MVSAQVEAEGSQGGMFPAAMVKEWPDARVHSKYHDQFVTLTREHAKVVLEDTFVYKLFEKHCSAVRERCASCTHRTSVPMWLSAGDLRIAQAPVSCCRQGHDCVSDTQYIGTVLSTKLGKSFASSVTDDVALVTGQQRGAFQGADIRVKTLIRLRGTTNQTPEYGGICEAVERCGAPGTAIDTAHGKAVHSGTRTCCGEVVLCKLHQPLLKNVCGLLQASV